MDEVHIKGEYEPDVANEITEIILNNKKFLKSLKHTSSQKL